MPAVASDGEASADFDRALGRIRHHPDDRSFRPDQVGRIGIHYHLERRKALAVLEETGQGQSAAAAVVRNRLAAMDKAQRRDVENRNQLQEMIRLQQSQIDNLELPGPFIDARSNETYCSAT